MKTLRTWCSRHVGDYLTLRRDVSSWIWSLGGGLWRVVPYVVARSKRYDH